MVEAKLACQRAWAATVAGDDITIGSVGDRSLLSGVIRTSHFKGVRTVFDPTETLATNGKRGDDRVRCAAGLCKNGSNIRNAVLGTACRNC
jgi:hypothetical protein